MITILAIGKKHEPWIIDGLKRYETRLKKPFDVKWVTLPHSHLEGNMARENESQTIISRLKPSDFVVLLDETGKNITSPEFAARCDVAFSRGQQLVLVIGGAYGVNELLRSRADFIWSLSKLVFPHQLVRLLLIEQIYRAQQILNGSAYHHD